MKNLISKLNTLKSIEPEENWVVETRKRVLSEAPVLGWKMTEVRNKQENKIADGFFSRSRNEVLPRLYNENAMSRVSAVLFSKKLAVSAFSFVFLVSGSALTVEASKSSLPGDSLYIIKIATEDVTLAVASKEKRPEIEIGQAGKRLEELTEISKKPSYDDQGRKAEQLLASFEKKINSAQNGLTEIENSGVKAKVAKVINIQTERYTEVLAETSENLPDVVKVEMSEKFASAVSSNEKVNFESLVTMVETVGENEEEKEEITAKVKEKIDELEEKIIINNEDSEEIESMEDDDKDDNDNTEEDLVNTADESENAEDGGEENEDSISEPKTVVTEEAKKELEKAKVSLESDNLSEAMKAIMNINITVDLIDSEGEPDPAGEEPTEDGSQGDEDGEVEGVSDEGEENEEGEDLKEESLE